MSVFTANAVDRLRTELNRTDVTDAVDELTVWRLLAAAPNERVARAGLACALELGKLSATVADWTPDERIRAATVDDGTLRRAVWWRHPITADQMILIPGGRGLVGEPMRSVEVPGFSVARYPTTNRQFAEFVEATCYLPEADETRGTFLAHWKEGRPSPKLASYPVTWVCAQDALAYAKWARASIPTDYQWEKAARGSDGRRYPWGNEPLGQLRRKGRRHLVAKSTMFKPVGHFPDLRSPYGCEDLVGIVSQWCLPHQGTPQRQRKEQLPVRGACYLRTSDECIAASHVRWLHKLRRNFWVGFRIAVGPVPPH